MTTLWADERVYYPLHALPYTPAGRLPGAAAIRRFTPNRSSRPLWRAKLRPPPCRFGRWWPTAPTVTMRPTPLNCGPLDWPFVLALKPHQGSWAPMNEAHTPIDAARELAWGGPQAPGAWTTVVRRFRDGHTSVWWAADAVLGGYGPHQAVRLIIATTDPATLPAKATWYLATSLPRPGGPRAALSSFPPADLAEIVRLYGLRTWIEQGYKQVKDELGWADFQVRSGICQTG
ncbi:hypothetical protein FHR32_007318 [Streptosporangium album]|uniref:Transposase IS701-like DDE domain-containing protein n=1 Tax=Streptosporangium album TaxID=47479 RepID=A0A7W7S2W7_9ACTN|nr:hypothetical protein [Streptosporangium album]